MKAILNLAKRVLPNHYSQMEFQRIDSKCEGKAQSLLESVPNHRLSEDANVGTVEKDFFILKESEKEGKVVIQGNSINSLTMGLGWYLKDVANCNLSWCGSNMALPDVLPPIQKEYSRVVEQKYRAYMNYCTFNYSASWWDWERWEDEIDYMALNGINLPLSIVGLEGVWYYVLLDIGFTDAEAREFLCGPAFLAWQWMTNIEGFCGPLPKDFIERRIELGQKIIKRERELGMQPIQQGFSGFVPKLLKEKFPEKSILKKEPWFGLEGTAQLDPTDPLFLELGMLFLEKQKELFGSYDYFAVDPFHEGEPPINTVEYMNSVGNSIKNLLNKFSPNSIWVAQSWSIRKDIVSVMDKDKLLILDLDGKKYEKTDYFWGYPFVIGNLHNFGARTNLHGDMELLASNLFSIIKEDAKNICGAGMFMEGIGQNPVYYDLAFEMMTRQDSANLNSWINSYAKRRYGCIDEKIANAWDLLLKTVYASGTNGVEKSSILCARPAVTCKKSGPNDGFHIPYGNKRVFKALELLLNSDAAPINTDGYSYDIVDILRQVLSNLGQKIYLQLSDSFKNRDKVTFTEKSNEFLQLLDDVDLLLSSRTEFRLDKWVNDARAWGKEENGKRFYEYNASVQLTIWGTEEKPHIFDYAWKEWSGLISQYYKPRWQMFIEMLGDCLDKDIEYIEDTIPRVFDRETFRGSEFYNKMADMECEWIKSIKQFDSSKPDSLTIVKELSKKYSGLIDKL